MMRNGHLASCEPEGRPLHRRRKNKKIGTRLWVCANGDNAEMENKWHCSGVAANASPCLFRMNGFVPWLKNLDSSLITTENAKCEAAAPRIHILPSCLISWRMNKLISHINHVKSAWLCTKGSYISKVNQLTGKLIDFKSRPICSGNSSSLLFWHLKCLIDAPLEVGGKSHDSTSVGGIQVQTQHVNKGRSGFQSETSAGSPSAHPLGVGWK